MRGVEVFPAALARTASGESESLHRVGQTSKVSRGGECTGKRPQLGGSSLRALGSNLTWAWAVVVAGGGHNGNSRNAVPFERSTFTTLKGHLTTLKGHLHSVSEHMG